MLMKAGIASPDGIIVREVPRPSAGNEQILVRVHAAGINRADLGRAVSLAGAAVPNVIGAEWAGEVVEVGSGGAGFKAGDRVVCSGTGGGYAEYAVADMGRALNIRDMDYGRAAVLPLALMTAHDALVTNGHLSPGGTVLILGAASAVGIATLQIARRVGARLIIGTSRNAEHQAKLMELGCTTVIDPGETGWAGKVLELTGGTGVDVTIDMVSGPLVSQSMSATAVCGHIVNVGRLGGAKAEFDCELHALRRLTYTGVTFRTRSVQEVREIWRRVGEDIWGAVEGGDIWLPVAGTFDLEDVAAAHRYMHSNHHFGKLLLRV